MTRFLAACRGSDFLSGHRGRLLACLVAVLFSAAQAEAAIVSFTSRDAFNAAVDANLALVKTVQTWDALPSGTAIPNGSSLDGVIYNSSAGNALITNAFLALTPPNGLGQTQAGFFNPGDTMTFTFPTPVVAFGISFNTFTTAPGAFLLTTNLGDVAPSAFNPFPGFDTGQFAGFISDTPITSVTVSAPGGFTYTLDNLTYATAIPEPGALALAGLGGLGLLGYAARRRQSR